MSDSARAPPTEKKSPRALDTALTPAAFSGKASTSVGDNEPAESTANLPYDFPEDRSAEISALAPSLWLRVAGGVDTSHSP